MVPANNSLVKRLILILGLIAIVLPSGSSEVFYDIDAGSSSVKMNATLELECQQSDDNCPVNRWSLNWDIPEDAKVISIEDSYGGIEDYTVSNNQVSISTNSGSRRTSETVRIQMQIDREAEHIHQGLYKRRINLAGFSGEKTSGTISHPDLISGWAGNGFNEGYQGSSMNFKGEGSTSVRINYGEGDETQYYEFFRGMPENPSLAYEISVGMTGLTQDFERFPVALMNPDNYEGSVVDWSAGEYVAGSFRMRDNLESQFLPVLAHETVHGLNDRELKWDETTSTWLDEGTSKYVESLVSLHLKGKDKTRNLFGDDTTYTEYRNGTRYRVTAPSSGDPQRLWDYYRQDGKFMKDWNPHDFPQHRSFGYAYSELIIRNYVVNEGGSLRELYDELDPRTEVTSNQEKWEIASEHLNLTPCRYESRERFDRCLERINNYDYEIYRANNVSKNQRDIEVSPLEIEEREETYDPGDLLDANNTNEVEGDGSSLNSQKIVRILADFFEALLETVKRLAGGVNN